MVIGISFAAAGCVHGYGGCLWTQPVKHTLSGRVHFRSYPTADGVDNVPVLTLDHEVYVYSPVPLSSLSEEQARDMQAAEAWISHTEPPTRSSHRPTHRHHHSGRVSLPVRSDEGLLPKYEKSH